MSRPIGISVPHRKVADDDDIQDYLSNSTYSHELVKRMIAEAVMAERDECAKLAKQFGGDWAEDAIRAREKA
jgi:hypothetical protein